MKVNVSPNIHGDQLNGYNGTTWLFTPETAEDCALLDQLTAQVLPTVQCCDRCGAEGVGTSHWPCSRPRRVPHP